MKKSKCCGAEITDRGFCSDCKDNAENTPDWFIKEAREYFIKHIRYEGNCNAQCEAFLFFLSTVVRKERERIVAKIEFYFKPAKEQKHLLIGAENAYLIFNKKVWNIVKKSILEGK